MNKKLKLLKFLILETNLLLWEHFFSGGHLLMQDFRKSLKRCTYYRWLGETDVYFRKVTVINVSPHFQGLFYPEIFNGCDKRTCK